MTPSINRIARRGFTLLELMVVIAVLGILAAVAIPAYNSFHAASKFTEVVASVEATKAEIEICVEIGNCADMGLTLGTSSGSSGTTTLSVGETLPAFEAYAQVAQAEASAAPTLTPLQWAQRMMNDIALGLPMQMSQCTAIPYLVVGVDATGEGENVCDSALANVDPNSAVFATLIAEGAIVPVSAFQSAYNALTGQGGVNHQLPCIGPTPPCTPPTKYVATEGADATGTITATAQTVAGLNAETFVLVPSVSGGRVDWTTSGTCKTRAGGALC
jgi:type IV pilus assembly protein PilA